MKKFGAILLACTMAFGLAACGGSKAESKSATKSAASNSAVSSASGVASDLKTVEEGKLHMATNASFPPYESTTDDGGFEGIDIDIAQEIANRLGLELVVDNMDFSAVVVAVQTDRDDIGMAGMTVNEDRKKNVDFTDTYANSVQVVIVPENSDIKTVDDLANNKKIGCQEGTTGYILCSSDPADDGYGADNTIAYADGATAVQALKAGKVDAVVIDEQPAKAYVESNKGLKILDTEFANEDYAIAVSKKNPALREAVNSVLNELKKDGTVQKIVDKYIKE